MATKITGLSLYKLNKDKFLFKIVISVRYIGITWKLKIHGQTGNWSVLRSSKVFSHDNFAIGHRHRLCYTSNKQDSKIVAVKITGKFLPRFVPSLRQLSIAWIQREALPGKLVRSICLMYWYYSLPSIASEANKWKLTKAKLTKDFPR